MVFNTRKGDYFMKKDQLKLKGTIPIIIGMCLMLAPLNLFETESVEYFSLHDFFGFAGFLTMTAGLYLLHRETGGFTHSIIASTVCTTASFVLLWVDEGHIIALFPKAAFCVLLYLMCTNYAKYANEACDHHMSHHFISHMWIDIFATSVELVGHAFGVHGIPSMVFLLVDLYCESMLMLHMWKFYKKYNGFHIERNASPELVKSES